MNDDERRWLAVQSRDASQRNDFLYGVVTTGIYCRAGCPSRLPKRANVRFYASPSEAEVDGMRPCLRCRPLAAESAQVDARFREACVFIRRNLDDREALKLNSLAARFGLSPFHFQRRFQAAVGLSPRRYVEALRMQTLKEELRSGTSVTDAIYAAGFGSGSRIYAGADQRLGMTPSQYRSGGQDLAITHGFVATPLGLILLGATDRGLCFLEFGASKADLLESLRQEFPRATLAGMAEPHSPEFHAWSMAVTRYLAGEARLAKLPLSLHGTAFQTRVWEYLQTLPAGTTRTYSQVAVAIGKPRAVRAVASACAANRIALAIPCHRVIRGDGGLGGYRWGLERKQALLALEFKQQQPSSELD